jgi:hypothetical protein
VQVVDSNGEITFNDINEYGVVTMQGGTSAGRLLAQGSFNRFKHEKLRQDSKGLLKK